MIIFDTETTGLIQPQAIPIEKQPQIIEFAAIKLDGTTLEEVDRLEFLCNPGRPLLKKITEITGITDADLSDKPSFAHFYPHLVKFFFGEDTLIAHNLAFDRDMLAMELRRIDKLLQFPWPQNHLCTVELSMGIKNVRLKLSSLHEIATGKTFEGAHRAMVDTEALVQVYKYLRKEGIA